MNTFFERAAEYNDKMNAIDRESDTAVIELLGYLDAFAEDIQWMAELEVPEQFSAVESLADEADENMKEAVALFHVAYDGEAYDEGSEQAAMEYYNRTNIRIQYIITILHGEIPEVRALPTRGKPDFWRRLSEPGRRRRKRTGGCGAGRRRRRCAGG